LRLLPGKLGFSALSAYRSNPFTICSFNSLVVSSTWPSNYNWCHCSHIHSIQAHTLSKCLNVASIWVYPCSAFR
jgi:hypothetical protein